MLFFWQYITLYCRVVGTCLSHTISGCSLEIFQTPCNEKRQCPSQTSCVLLPLVHKATSNSTQCFPPRGLSGFQRHHADSKCRKLVISWEQPIIGKASVQIPKGLASPQHKLAAFCALAPSIHQEDSVLSPRESQFLGGYHALSPCTVSSQINYLT